jgi:hypothetical protein
MQMVKIILLRCLIFIPLSAILFFGFLILYTIIPSFHFGPMVDSKAFIEAYIDENANGIKDKDELPLANVCVDGGPFSVNLRDNSSIEEWISFTCSTLHNVTDTKGEWGDFKAGSKCSDLILYAVVPEGYQPTTDLVAIGCHSQFGFIPAGSISQKNVDTFKNFLDRKKLMYHSFCKI